jgi:PIN domain nuclease of toxin-antitoxin system
MLNLDTHILLFALAGELTARERRLLATNRWSISAIVLWEIARLSQQHRIELALDAPELTRLLAAVHIWPLTLEICRKMGALDFASDPADEIIAATSLTHNVPLLTRDRRILRSKVLRLAR